jgi:hypothetical protein
VEAHQPPSKRLLVAALVLALDDPTMPVDLGVKLQLR